MMMRTDYVELVSSGCAEAGKEMTAAGEFAAWDRVVAQRIDVHQSSWRPPAGLAAALRVGKPMNTARESGERLPDPTGYPASRLGASLDSA